MICSTNSEDPQYRPSLENLRDNYLNIDDNALLDELETLVNLINDNNNLIDIDFDFSLVRGLEYYTGLIYEISLDSKSDVGSLGGGGRYENLTEAFNLRDNSGRRNCQRRK